MTCVLAIDQGTTGTTCLIVAADGRVIGRGYREITQFYPQPGFVEHDAHEILMHTLAAAREALSDAWQREHAVPVAIGISNQRETIVLWDRETGRAVHHAIVWQDRRTAARCASLLPNAEMITRRTGLVTDPYFSATKLEWLLSQGDNAKRAARGELLAGTIDTWLIWNLTGGEVHATDHTNASRTMLYDINVRAWNDELLTLFGVPRALLADVRPSSGNFGMTRIEHLGIALPIRGVAGDQQAALFGQGGWRAGSGKNTYGTGAFLLMNAGGRRPVAREALLTTIACDATGNPVFALEASIFIAGAAIQWLRDGLNLFSEAADSEVLARSLTGNDGVYFVPALVGLGAPDWEPGARGTIVGLSRGTTSAHLARAALEAMAFATFDVLGDMRTNCGDDFHVLRVDGGASGNDWLMQFQADVLGVPVERPDIIESTALGVAGLAGIASGVWPDAESFLSARQFTRFVPGVGRDAAVAAHMGWRRAVRAALFWARDTGV